MLTAGQWWEEADDIAGRQRAVGVGVLAVHQHDARQRGRNTERLDHVGHAARVGNVENCGTGPAARGEELGERGEEPDLDRHLA